MPHSNMFQKLMFNIFVIQHIIPAITMSDNNILEDFYKKSDWFQVARCEAHCLDLKMINLGLFNTQCLLVFDESYHLSKDSFHTTAVQRLHMQYPHKNKRKTRCFFVCVDWCLHEDREKSEGCPAALKFHDSVSWMARSKTDTQSSKSEKWCRSERGDLPPIPRHVTIKDPNLISKKRHGTKKGRIKSTFQIRWSFDQTNDINKSYSGSIVYILEEGHQLKRRNIANNQEKVNYVWTSCAHTRKRHVRIRNSSFRPGHWYRFRVSAVGANGTQGPSHPSYGHMTGIMPVSPGVPQGVTVTPLSMNNNTLTVELQWKAPKSITPIDKYKVFWSRQLFDPIVFDAVLVYQQIVSKHKTKLIIKNLKMPILYFFQVQAFSYFNNKKLEGKKSGLVYNYNTTQEKQVLVSNTISKYPPMKNFVDDLQIEKTFINNRTLNARIRWKQNPFNKSTKYAITSACYCGNTKFGSYRKENITLTRLLYYNLENLKFHCRYEVSVQIFLSGKRRSKEAIINFTTPKCDYFLKRNDNITC